MAEVIVEVADGSNDILQDKKQSKAHFLVTEEDSEKKEERPDDGNAAVSISDLEQQLRNENLTPNERKRLKRKLKKRRQRQKRQTETQEEETNDDFKESILEESTTPAEQKLKEVQNTKDKELAALINREQENADITPIEEKFREAQDTKDKELAELKNREQEDINITSAERKMKETQYTKDKELAVLINREQEDVVIIHVKEKLKEAQDAKDEELQALKDRETLSNDESSSDMNSSERKLKEAQDSKELELRALKNHEPVKSGLTPVEQKLREVQEAKDRELTELKNREVLSSTEPGGKTVTSTEQKVRESQQCKDKDLAALQNCEPVDSDITPAVRNLKEAQEAKERELQALKNRGRLSNEGCPDMTHTKSKVKQAQESKERELKALKNREQVDYGLTPAERKIMEARNAKDEELKILRKQELEQKKADLRLEPAERNLKEARTSQLQELEALRSRGLAARKSKKIKNAINKNVAAQQQEQQQQGDMEWRKVGENSDSLPSPISSPTMAYEQMAFEQNKERAENREKERETMMQYHHHPESLKKDSKYLLEMDFVFGLVIGKNDEAPDKYSSTKAAAKIVPNMLATKKTIYYDPRYPPKVSTVEVDPEFDKPGQIRYMVKGKVPVLPKNGSPREKKSGERRRSSSSKKKESPSSKMSSSRSASEVQSPTSPPSPSLPLDMVLEVPILKVRSTGEPDKSLQTSAKPTPTEEADFPLNFEGRPRVAVDDDLRTPSQAKVEEIRSNKYLELKALSQRPSEKVVEVSAMSSRIKVEIMRSSQVSELEALRQRGVAKQKNRDFAKLEEQSALDKAAYEADKQDLERRRSSVSEYHFSGGAGITPHDTLVLQQNRQKKEDREIRQNTIREYQGTSLAGIEINSTTQLAKASKVDESSLPRKQEALQNLELEVARQRRYIKMFKKKPSRAEPSNAELDEIWQRTSQESLTQVSTSSGVDAHRQRRYDAIFERPSQTKMESIKSKKDSELDTLRQRPDLSKGDLDGTLQPKSKKKIEYLRSSKTQELEALRQSGVSKKTSEEFIKLEERSALDKAAYEAEKQDLERRKSSVSNNHSQKPGSRCVGLLGFGMFMKASKKKKKPSTSGVERTSASRPSLTQSKSQSNHEITISSEESQEVEKVHRQGLAKTRTQSNRELQNAVKQSSRESQELEALRRQGLAKRGSQAFVEFEKQSKEIQTAQDAADRDLEERKAKTSEYKFQGTKEISPVDALYLDHHKWKKDTQKQDRQALGLYDQAPDHLVTEEGEEQKHDTKFTNQDGYRAWQSSESPVVGDLEEKKKRYWGEQVENNCACVIM